MSFQKFDDMIKVRVSGDISLQEVNEIKEYFIGDPIQLTIQKTKSQATTEIIELIFSDLSPIAFIRDTVIGITLERIIVAISNVVKNNKLKNLTINYNDQITLMGKTFFLNITCLINQVANIRTQIMFKLTPYVQGLIPDQSVLIVKSNHDDTLKIIIREPSGSEYSI